MEADAAAPTGPDDTQLMAVLHRAAGAVGDALGSVRDLRRRGDRPGQYALDLVADEVLREVLHQAGLAVFSEESGYSAPGRSGQPGQPGQPGRSSAGEGDDPRALLVVADPVDGSTNASLGIPWYATSLCLLDADGPRMALVANQATGARYQAVRGGGAWRDGRPLEPSGCATLADAVVGVSGLPGGRPGWWQFRALGAAALDLCLVAEGVLDAFCVAGGSTLAAWDYLGGLLVCTEAGAVVAERDGAELVVRDGKPRRPLAAATAPLRDALLSTPL